MPLHQVCATRHFLFALVSILSLFLFLVSSSLFYLLFLFFFTLSLCPYFFFLYFFFHCLFFHHYYYYLFILYHLPVFASVFILNRNFCDSSLILFFSRRYFFPTKFLANAETITKLLFFSYLCF